jgi:hypothetical protein
MTPNHAHSTCWTHADSAGPGWAPEDPNARFFGLDEAEFDQKIQPGYKSCLRPLTKPHWR